MYNCVAHNLCARKREGIRERERIKQTPNRSYVPYKSAPTGHLLQFEFEFEFDFEFVTIECDCEISSIRTGCVRANIMYD